MISEEQRLYPDLTEDEKTAFAALVASGMPQGKAYTHIRPHVVGESARVSGSKLARRPEVKERIRGKKLAAADEIFVLSTNALRDGLKCVNKKLQDQEELSSNDIKLIGMGQALVVEAIGKESEHGPHNAAAELLSEEVVAALIAHGNDLIKCAKESVVIDVTPAYDRAEVELALSDRD